MTFLIYPIIAWLIMNNMNKDVKRGIRNNNPGNIRIANNNWKGKVPVGENTDGSFEQFISPEYGIRAMGVLLRNYINQGDNTIQEIISRYAPSNENKTDSYIKFVSSKMGILPYQTLYNFNVPSLVEAIIAFENGEQPYARSFINNALNMV